MSSRSPAADQLEAELGFRLEIRGGEWWLVSPDVERRADLSEERMWLMLLEARRGQS